MKIDGDIDVTGSSIGGTDQGVVRISFTVDVGAKTLVIGVAEPFKMWLPDAANPGSSVEKTITAPATINGYGHGSENFNTGEVGQTLAVAWGEDYPITWYVTIESGNIYWVCSRNPCMTKMPSAAGYIGDFDAEPATAVTLQTNVFIAASVTVADFVDLPVWPIGTMPVQRTAASQIPTLVALTAGRDGAGLWNEQRLWAMPTGQNGADAGGYVYAAAGTNPTYGYSQSIRYTQSRSGLIDSTFYLRNNSGGTAGSGTNILKISMPLAPVIEYRTHSNASYNDGLSGTKFASASADRDNSGMYIFSHDTLTPMIQNDQSDADIRRITGGLIYQAF